MLYLLPKKATIITILYSKLFLYTHIRGKKHKKRFKMKEIYTIQSQIKNREKVHFNADTADFRFWQRH